MGYVTNSLALVSDAYHMMPWGHLDKQITCKFGVRRVTHGLVNCRRKATLMVSQMGALLIKVEVCRAIIKVINSSALKLVGKITN